VAGKGQDSDAGHGGQVDEGEGDRALRGNLAFDGGADMATSDRPAHLFERELEPIGENRVGGEHAADGGVRRGHVCEWGR